MMSLYTRPFAVDSHVIVAWATGKYTNGFLRLDVNENVEDRLIRAELHAIEYLMFRKRVFNVDPANGKSFTFYVSTGAIKKLALQRSQKTHLFDAAAFFTTRLVGAQIHVVKSNSLAPEWGTAACDRTEPVTSAGGWYSSTTFESPVLGTVEVSAHALRRFVQRLSSGTPTAPWRSLMRRLSHPGLRQYPLPERHQRHKMRKYGTVEGLEIWAHPTSSMAFLFINEGTRRRLLTVFKRDLQGW